ncbi:MAG: kelch repeat-containing protein [Planctomycetota bacterium]
MSANAVAVWQADGSTIESISQVLGTPNGAISYSPSLAGTGFVFSGITAIDMPDSPTWDLAGSEFTLELWVNLANTTSPMGFVGHNEGGGPRPKWFLMRNYAGVGTLTLHTNGPGGVRDYTVSWSINPNVWIHVVVTKSAGSLDFWADGVHLGSTQILHPIPDASSPLQIGGPGEGGGFTQGMIDGLAIYNRALFGAEIAAHFGSGGLCGPSSSYLANQLQQGAVVPAVADHAIAALPGSGALLFSGRTANGLQPTTHTLLGSTWTEAFPALHPSPRTGHALVLDPTTQTNLLYGGADPGGTALNDTWTWANGTWAIHQGASPPARSGHRMACDTARSTVLLFGGRDTNGTALGDFWSFDGSTWTPNAPVATPPQRYRHGMAYDAKRDRTVVFGGSNGATRLADTWEWDGANWQAATLQGPTASFVPSARDGHAMAYDPLSQRIVIYGGESANYCLQEVWSLDSSGFTLHLLAPQLAPSPRRDSQMVHDTGTNRMILFAGGCQGALANDLWTLELPVLATTESYGLPCIGTNGPLGLQAANGSRAILGTTFDLEVTGVPLFSPCLGFIGFSNTSFGGTPLPFSLTPLNMSGCFAYQSADLNFALAATNNATNTAAWPLAIPNDPIFLAMHIYLQALALEFGGARFATTTNGIEARIGNR